MVVRIAVVGVGVEGSSSVDLVGLAVEVVELVGQVDHLLQDGLKRLRQGGCIRGRSYEYRFMYLISAAALGFPPLLGTSDFHIEYAHSPGSGVPNARGAARPRAKRSLGAASLVSIAVHRSLAVSADGHGPSLGKYNENYCGDARA